MVLHLVAAYAVCRIKTGFFPTEKDASFVSRIFDSATFASSGVVLLGIFEPSILALIGNTKPFLMVAGLAGFVYGIHAIFRD